MTRYTLRVLSSGVTQCTLCAPLGKTRSYFRTTIRRHPEAYEFVAKDGVSASNEHSAVATTKVQSAVAEGEGSARLLKDERDAAAVFLKKPGGDSSDDDDGCRGYSSTTEAGSEYDTGVSKKSRSELPYVDTSHAADTPATVE